MQTPNMDSKLQEVHDFYTNRIIGWMINDLKKSIEAETNFLTALGCLIYTEIIGILLPPLPNEKSGSSNERRFYRCFFRFVSNNYLENLDKFIRKETNKGIYQHLRHSMTHRYYPRIDKITNKVILSIPSVIARDGTAVNMSDGLRGKSPPIYLSSVGEIVIATRNYTDELFKAVKDFMKFTFEENQRNYIEYAKKGIDVILRGTK